MNIAILGAGIIGVTTAYELAADGHAVTVFERRASIAEEASFATAGILGPGAAVPWVARPLGRGMLMQEPSIRMVRPLSLADRIWARRRLAASAPSAFAASRARQQWLAIYSSHRLHEVSERLAYTFDRTEGHLMLLRNHKERADAEPSLANLREMGVPFHEITADEARQLEPSLNPNTRLAGAIYLPQDEVGNCRQFAVILRDAAEQLGARFHFHTPVTALGRATPASVQIAGEDTPRHYDAVVLCAGAQSAALLAPLGIKVPLQPVYGYSISAAIPETGHAPRSGVTDMRNQVSITRHGRRVRVSGAMEIGGLPDRMEERAMRTLYQALADWFPSAGRLSSGVQAWKGACPMLPDGSPLIGPSGIAGLWLNLGHGSSGWALACGSARLLAHQIGGLVPQIDTEGLGLR